MIKKIIFQLTLQPIAEEIFPLKISPKKIGCILFNTPETNPKPVKMKYIINNTIVFDSDHLTLFLHENKHTSTLLTKPATRLLLVLIQKNKISIARSDLLEKVWISYGFSASNAGLNNYISELRKAFLSLGYNDEIIITLPKFGFRLEADININDSIIITPSVVLVEENTILNNISKASGASREKPTAIEKNSSSLLHKKKLLTLFFCILPIIILGTFAFITTKHANYTYRKITMVDNCDVYILGKTRQTNALTTRINTIIKNEDIDCRNIPADVFYLEDRLSKNMVLDELITVCRKKGDDYYESCFNIRNQRSITK